MGIFKKVISTINNKIKETELHNFDYYVYSRRLFNACEEGDIQYITEQIDRCKTNNLKIPFNEMMNTACANGEFIVAKLLLTNHYNEYEKFNFNHYLRNAVYSSNNEIVNYLISNPKFSKNIDLDKATENILLPAIESKKVKNIFSVLKNKNIKEKLNLHVHDDFLFRFAFTNHNTDLIEYLVFDLKLKKTPTIKHILENGNNLNLSDPYLEKVRNIFIIGNQNNELEPVLSSTEVWNKIAKRERF